MANAAKTVARSRRSHRDNKNFNQFILNAHQKAEAKANRELSELIAEQLKKKKENE